MKPFKSINLFRLPADHGLSLTCIEADLFTKPSTPCGPGDMETRGFVPPAPHMPDQIVYFNQQAVLIHLQTETKIIPSAVVKQEAAKRIASIEKEEGRKVGRKEAKDIQETCRDTLKLTAFTKITTQRAIIDLKMGLVMIEASSTGKAEDMLSALREALGGLNTKLVQINRRPSSAMTFWVFDGPEDEFLLGDFCEMKSEESGATAKCSRQDLDAVEVEEHLRTGKVVTKLALEWKDKISFQLTENLEIKRVKFMDILQDQLKGADVDTQDAMFESSATLFIGEIRLMIADLIDALGGEVA
ncbi:putative exonuclease RdgC [Iodobacter phage PhiPLPE]|uniref:Putative exonuclease RdgC n=1 Tax=Iodobacter phage PhiPLPE TaxID=551895 RepID=B5AX95_9CAUD|nr:exonuclease recombination-associated [Iodobacter phage PhiPLPE]ACG60398.1 putative exonuclease RdgC [Iodobacter phage PhiPLPE]